MNLNQKNNELINLILEYLKNQTSMESLQNFSWEIIDYFNKTNKTKLPPHQEFEKEFWYAIWQIQHLADEEHERENVTRKVISEALDYLQKKKKIPNDLVSMRP